MRGGVGVAREAVIAIQGTEDQGLSQGEAVRIEKRVESGSNPAPIR